MTRNKLLGAVAALSLVMGVAACGGEAEAPATEAPEAPEGISVADAWLSLPAVAGNPGAAYFTVKNAGENDAMIRAVNVAGAESAMIHETAEWNGQVDMQELIQLAVPRDSEVELAPGGKHVMAMGIDPALVAGGETEVTLIFVNGDKISFPAKILGPGQQP